MLFHDLDIRLKLLALLTAAVFFILVVGLVKNKYLKENYAILWMLFAFVMAVLAWNFDFVRWISQLLGIANPNNTVFFLSIMFLILIVIVFSIEISELQIKVKNLIQEVSLLKSEKGRKP